MTYPTNTQELFDQFISARRTVISECGGGEEYFELLQWAVTYADEHGLNLQKDLDTFNICYLPEGWEEKYPALKLFDLTGLDIY